MMLGFYLKAKWVEAGFCTAANRSVSSDLHCIQQVLVTETGRPADLELSLLNTAGTKVMELERDRKKNTRQNCVLFSLLGD